MRIIKNNSVVAIWKPRNLKSTDVVNLIKSKYRLKVGHAGTLDPFAEGVLLICTGKKTKKVAVLHKLDKIYTARIKLGERTNTLDIDGELIQKKKVPKIKKEFLKLILKKFEGIVMQRPPSFSAIRKNNIRLYELARKDIYINVKPRKVRIEKINLLSFNKDILKIQITCGTGTYIRSLSRDIGKALNTCAYLQSLKRLSIGEYNDTNCIQFKSIVNDTI